MYSIRRTLVHVLIMLVILFGLNLVFTDDQVRADRAACDQIKTACKNAGFVLGGGARNGLLVDCSQQIVQGTAQPKSASKPLPKINSQLVNACRAGRDSAPIAAPASAPLVPAADGQTVYDPNLKVTWLGGGALYYGALEPREPTTAVRIPPNKVGPFNDFQPYLYWSASPAADPKQGFVSFSFSSGFQGANVWRNYLYVLPMIKRKLPGTPPAAGEGLQVNPGGQTVYDPIAQVTWLAEANLAAKQTFGVANINPDGSMEHSAAVLWVAAMNKADQGRGYLGQKDWQLPDTGPPDPSCSMKGTTGFDCTGSAMGELFYKQLGLHRGDSVVAAPDVKVGPFRDIQPYLYWACEG